MWSLEVSFLTLAVEVHMPFLVWLAVILVASGLPRHVNGFDWQLLQHTVVVFSTFSFVSIVLEVQHELGLHDRVVLLLGLLLVSQASVLAMFCLVNASKVSGGVETILSVEKVSNVRRRGTVGLLWFQKGGAWKQLSSMVTESLVVLEN